MTIAEALMERKDLIRDINRVKEEVYAKIKVPEHEYSESDESDIQDNISLYFEIMNELRELNDSIDKANIPIQKELNKLQMLDSQISFYKEMRFRLLSQDNYAYRGFSADAMKFKKTLNLENVNSELKEVEEERRDLDKYIQKFNWNTNIEE